MGEFAMPMPTMSAMSPELMAAMSIFGGAGDMPAVSAENGSQVGSFGDVLGLLMANSVQTQVQIQPVPEMTEAEAAPETTAADILYSVLEGGNDTVLPELPEVFSEKGAEAFIETLSRILPEYDGEVLPEDIGSLWKDVPPEEKKAFAELLYAAADFSEEESIQADKSPEDIVRIICRIMVSSVRKPEKKVSDKPELSDEAVLFQGMNLFRPVQTVSPDSMGKEDTADGEEMIAVENAPIQRTEGVTYPEMTAAPETDRLRETDDSFPVQVENSEETMAQSVENVPFADIRDAYEKLSEADPEDIISFCRKLADELNASVKETAPEAVHKAAAETAPEISDRGHIGFGRQGMQGFMARINRHEKLPVESSTEIILEQTENKGAVTDIPKREVIPEGEDVPSQIMRQIDLYRDIFEESFSEKEISMKLAPESLGGVEIRIRKSDKGFEITFTAEKAEAAELIGNKASELSEALASRGIALKELSVTHRIVTNESDGSLTGEAPFGNGSLYGDAQNGQNSSDRHFYFGEQGSSDSAEQAEEGSSDNNFNREAKLWVSA